MFGDFTVDTGKYNFVYAGILKKEFELKKGGTLIWTGDPKKALINLNTSYSNIQANPSILLDSPVNLTIPVNVNVNLFGELLNPFPEFELEFPNVDSSINNGSRSINMWALMNAALSFGASLSKPFNRSLYCCSASATEARKRRTS
jgi:hypothetical protein